MTTRIRLCGWLVLIMPSLLSGQRLSEFLQVKGWNVTLTTGATNEGTHTGSDGKDKWTAAVRGTATGKLDKFDEQLRMWTGKMEGTVSLDYRMESEATNGCKYTITRKGAGPLESLGGDDDFLLSLGPFKDEFQMMLWKARIQVTITSTTACPGQQSVSVSFTVPETIFPSFGPAFTDPIPLPDTGLNLTGVVKAHWFRPSDGISWRGNFLEPPPLVTADVNYSITPTGVSELLLEVESAEYANWRPTAKKDGSQGEPISFKATLRNQDGSQVTQEVKKFTWELKNTSKEPGIAMNWPPENPQTEHDMRFEVGDSQSALDDTLQTLEISFPGRLYDTAKVNSFDWGGWSTLQVTAELIDGKQIHGEFKGTGEKDIRLPKRKEGSFIAEDWKREPGRDGDDNSDDEQNEGGDPAYKGDGLTLYEEYRGFYINGDRENESEQADPQKKDLFVLNLGGADVDTAGTFLKKHAGIRVHTNVLRSEMSDGRVINRHYDSLPRRGDQHGVIVKVDGSISGFAQAVSGNSRPGTPKSISVIRIPISMPARRGSGRTSYGALTIAHEMLHSMAVYHHGDADDRQVMWDPDGNGKFHEYGATFDGEGNHAGYESAPAGNVDLRTESGATIPQRRLEGLIGVKEGPHSGDGFCIMRYDVANAYVADADASLRYVVSETPGVSVCSSSEGDGVNADGWTPQSRYGKAASGRGNCKHQIVISDLYDPPQR